MSAPITDYRALRKQVKAKQAGRRTVKYPICLDSSLYDEYADLQEQARQEELASIDSDKPMGRAGDLDAAGKLEALEERIRLASLVAVFHVPTPEQQAQRNASWQDVSEADQPAAQRFNHILASARSNVLDNFAHFLDHDGNEIPAAQFGLEDLKELAEDWPQGLLFALSKEITDRSTEEPELPFSVRRSLLHPTSAATSK